MRLDGRADHIEDYLITVRSGQWFGWSDSKNKIYANLIVHDGGSKPTESDCTNGLKALQDAWDLENDSYKSQRKAEYPSIEDQLDTIYHSGVTGWKTAIKTIKDKYPKP
tara:strand:- start:1280 stop:1606 length:327 start_codon:yes stop_codon:yes gene_type:complete